MRILVISDVHETTSPLQRVLDKHPDIKTVIFLGDGLRQVEEAASLYPDRRFLTVPGNCDWMRDKAPTGEAVFEGKRVFYTHGHLYRAKYSTELLEQEGRRRQADLVLFGHTHVPFEQYEDGLYLLNPGTLGYGDSYAVVDISPAGIMPTLMRL